jgi:rhamnosyltransferase
MSRKVLMTHPIGQAMMRRILVFTLACSNHAPIRRYYMTRNRILVARTYFRLEPRLNASEVAVSFRDMLAVILLERDKRPKLHAMLLGLWHGLMGYSGKLENPPWEPRATGAGEKTDEGALVSCESR